MKRKDILFNLDIYLYIPPTPHPNLRDPRWRVNTVKGVGPREIGLAGMRQSLGSGIDPLTTDATSRVSARSRSSPTPWRATVPTNPVPGPKATTGGATTLAVPVCSQIVSVRIPVSVTPAVVRRILLYLLLAPARLAAQDKAIQSPRAWALRTTSKAIEQAAADEDGWIAETDRRLTPWLDRLPLWEGFGIKIRLGTVLKAMAGFGTDGWLLARAPSTPDVGPYPLLELLDTLSEHPLARHMEDEQLLGDEPCVACGALVEGDAVYALRVLDIQPGLVGTLWCAARDAGMMSIRRDPAATPEPAERF